MIIEKITVNYTKDNQVKSVSFFPKEEVNIESDFKVDYSGIYEMLYGKEDD